MAPPPAVQAQAPAEDVVAGPTLEPSLAEQLHSLALVAECHDLPPKSQEAPRQCLLCKVVLCSDNKSPVPTACYECWQEQEKVSEVCHSQQPQPDVPLAPPVNTPDSMVEAAVKICAECAVVITDKLKSLFPNFCSRCFHSNVAKRSVVPAPDRGWERSKDSRESEHVWYARCQRHLDNHAVRTTKSQKHYVQEWIAMTSSERELFRQKVHRLKQGLCLETAEADPDVAPCLAAGKERPAVGLLPSPPATAPNKTSLCIPDGYDVNQLVADYRHAAQDSGEIMSKDQERYEMYGKLALLIKHGVVRSVTACGDKSLLES